MVLNKFVYAFLCIFIFSYSRAQDLDMPKVSQEDLEAKVYAKDATAPAVYLYKTRETYFDYAEEDGWFLITLVTERIKILNKDGLDYATRKVKAYKNDSEAERIEKVEGVTYNLEEGKINKVKLDEGVLYEKNINEHWDEFAFTMPAAKVGSVIEWSYRLVSPFLKIDDLVLQENIPVSHYLAKIRYPRMFGFRLIKKGNFEIEPKTTVDRRSLNFSYDSRGGYGTTTLRSNTAKANFSEVTNYYEKNDIPALKPEPYVNNLNNYRFSVFYELISTEFSEGNLKNYATTWEEVAQTIFKSKNFGKQLENTRFLKKEAEVLKEKYPDKAERIEQVLQFVQSKMTWNGYYGKYTEEDISRVYKEGVGNVAEINLILVALLRESGIDANPVLVSSKNNGIPMFPTLEGFNYVIAGIREPGRNILLDGTDKYSTPNILPARVYNWTGRMINKYGASQEVELLGDAMANEFLSVTGTIDGDGKLTGTVSRRYGNNEALRYRDKYDKLPNEEIKKLAAEELAIEDLKAFEVENMHDIKKPVIESFNFETGKGMDVIGSNIYLSPLLFYGLEESPFKSEERNFPVDFLYPFSTTKTFNLKIPDTYKVLSLPEPLNVALPENLGAYTYKVVVAPGGLIQAISRFSINRQEISERNYKALREFFKLRVEKEKEKIVLEKI
ncbi:DUF3857 domain-containing protein [Zunongwangia sp. H14]|uniref:DUF3857 domain-containing protein n=1 Tax=Zunongwangia sp. H14 TaxID=3240792 RepID=UPI003564C36C